MTDDKMKFLARIRYLATRVGGLVYNYNALKLASDRYGRTWLAADRRASELYDASLKAQLAAVDAQLELARYCEARIKEVDEVRAQQVLNLKQGGDKS